MRVNGSSVPVPVDDVLVVSNEEDSLVGKYERLVFVKESGVMVPKEENLVVLVEFAQGGGGRKAVEAAAVAAEGGDTVGWPDAGTNDNELSVFAEGFSVDTEGGGGGGGGSCRFRGSGARAFHRIKLGT